MGDAADPARAVPLFLRLLETEQTWKAHSLLSAGTQSWLRQEQLAMALVTYPDLKRLLRAVRVEDALRTGEDTALVRLHHPWLGIRRAVRLVRFRGRIWTLDIGKTDFEEWAAVARRWLRAQYERADGYQVFPPDHRFRPVRGGRIGNGDGRSR